MGRFIAAIVLSSIAAQGVFAQPALKHAHRHRHADQHERDVDFNNPDLYKDVNWSSVFASDKPAATPAPVAAPVVAPVVAKPAPEKAKAPAPAKPAAPATSSKSSTSSSDPAKALFGGVTTPIDNGIVDEYIGNVGIPWGSNIVKISDVNGAKYTNNFISSASAPIQIIVWNKSGADGRPNSGQFSAPALSFELAPGASQVVAFDENSQVAWCQFTGAKSAYNANDCTYGEADFGNISNNGYSGYDVSLIQSGAPTPMMITSPNGKTSSTSDTSNIYTSDKQAGGIGGNLAPGPVRLTTTLG